MINYLVLSRLSQLDSIEDRNTLPSSIFLSHKSAPPLALL